MKMLITVSGLGWQDEKRYIRDVVKGLEAVGHTVTVGVEENSRALAEYEQAGLTVQAVPSYDLETLGAVATLARLIRAEVPRLICVTGHHDAVAVHRVLKDEPGDIVRVVYRQSAYPFDPIDETRDLLGATDLVLAASKEQAERHFRPFVDAGVLDRQQIEVVADAVRGDGEPDASSADRETFRERFGLTDRDFALAVAGELTWETGVDRVIRVLAELRKEQDPYPVLLIAGQGPLETELRALAAEEGVADRVRFLGAEGEPTEHLLVACDAVVLATEVPAPGALVLKEAMALGRPVLASIVGGIPEFVADEGHGFLFGDEEDLQDAVRRMLADPPQLARMGESARRSIREGHRLEQRVNYLAYRLDLLALERSPFPAVLDDFAWDEVRLRKESEGGFVFVPHTSYITELGPTSFGVVSASIERGTVSELAHAGAARELACQLYEMGALKRHPAPEPAALA
ncbi:glycosyltransferase family 4 protein [Streptomyces sp. NPDC088726]|uniref:glycosyltransferase family 4 protein n=1 Tax=Streptomyces sp. NPDC088726 TaxID=3365874 RepID=UPI0037F75DCE